MIIKSLRKCLDHPICNYVSMCLCGELRQSVMMNLKYQVFNT